jgi:glycosyltransferase involved in cell wall biosynthesis
MHVLRVHNYYQQPGGEDQSFASEVQLLKNHGHRVSVFTVHNESINTMGQLEVARKTIWNDTTYRELRAFVQSNRPDVVHFENVFPLISPAAYYAMRTEGIPVIQSLRNYRLFCANAYFFRSGQVCEDCLGKSVPWPALRYACYRDSRAATGTVVAMLMFHRVLGTWQRVVDCFVALTEFNRNKFIEGGLPAEKIAVKPNFLVSDPGPGKGDGGYALFAGRLSAEKGILPLLNAWRVLGKYMPLYIIGDGPLRDEVKTAAMRHSHINWLGHQQHAQILALMKAAHVLIFPSLWYEGFPRVILEAFAVGLPVLASKVGSMASLVEHGYTGLHFQVGDSADLAQQVALMLNEPALRTQMGQAARATYEQYYTAERNYELLSMIYKKASSL